MTTSGIGAIKNIENEKIFAFKSFNLEDQWEIYKNQLRLNIHHNLKLQKDWNTFGSECFEFLIIEEIYDEFDLEEGFVDYVSLLDNSYNQFSISSFVFEYLGKSSLMILFDLIGEDSCSPEFLNTLKKNDLSEENYYEIKEDMVSLIENGFIDDNQIEDKLYELIQDKSYQIRVFNLDTQYKLINKLEDITGIYELNEEFNSKLLENGLSKSSGVLIRDNIMQLIFSNNIDINIEKQIDSCIEIIKEKISQETIEKLLVRLNNLENDEEFINKLEESNLPLDIGSKITNNLNDLILSGLVNEDTFSEKVDELINIEVENQWLETKKELHAYLTNTIYSDEIKIKLKTNHLNQNVIPKINKSVKESIENKEIVSKEDVDEEINKCIKQEADNIIKLRDELLLYLRNEFGSDEITSSFETKLINAQLDMELGKNYILEVSKDINSFEVSSVDEVDKLFETLIFNENKNILFKEFYNLVGKDENTELFSSKLKLNYLTEEDGAKIRKELFNLFYTENNLEKIIEYRNNLELKLDEIIEIEGQKNYKKIVDLSDELIESLNEIVGETQINTQFKQKLYLNNLGEDYRDLIKVEVTQMIEKEEDAPNFELKMNQLNCLKKKGIGVIVNEIVLREAKVRREEYILLKEELTAQSNELIGAKENTQYYDELLSKNNLNIEASKKIRNTLFSIIASDRIYDSKQYNYKYEELISVKNQTIKKVLLNLVNLEKRYYENILHDLRSLLRGKVEVCIGRNSVKKSFQRKLYSNQLSLDYADTFKKYMYEFINGAEVYDKKNFKFKFDELTYLNNTGVDSKLDELIEKESQIKHEELTNLKNKLNNDLDTLIGKNENNEYYNNLLKLNNLNSKTGDEIRLEIVDLINSHYPVDDVYEFKLDELIALDKKGLREQLNEIIEKEKSEYDINLKTSRDKLLKSLKDILSKESFKETLYSKQIDDSFIDVINKKLTEMINSDDPCDDKFEVKLDELEFIDKEGIVKNVNQLVKNEEKIRQKEFNDLQSELSDILFSLIGKDKNSMIFNFKLVNNNLNESTRDKIREELIDLVSSNECQDSKYHYKLAELIDLKELGVENKIDELINREHEKYKISLKETRKNLIDQVNITLGKSVTTVSFKRTLLDNNLEEDFAYELKRQLLDFINSDEVSNKEFKVKLDELKDLEKLGIKTKIMEFIDKELERRSQILKENQLKELYNITGDIPLSEEFINKLNNANFDKEFGIKIINHYKSEIDSSNIPKGFDFEKGIDDMILDESRNILYEETYEIIGKESNSDYFTNKLKENMITTEMGEDIRSELISMIEDADLKTLVKLRDIKMKTKCGEKISVLHISRLNKLNELRKELLQDLDQKINVDSFKKKLSYKNLNAGYVDKIKTEIEDFINSDEVEENFEFKVDELENLSQVGIGGKIDEIIDRESTKINLEFDELRKSLLRDLDKDIAPSNSFTFAKMEIARRKLTDSTQLEAYKTLRDLIKSNQIKNQKFTSKYDELQDLKDITVKKKFVEIIEEYSKEQEKLIKFLHSKTTESRTFNEQIKSSDLSENFVNKYLSKTENKIRENLFTNESQITHNINSLLKNEVNEQNKALERLYTKVGKKRISLSFRAILLLKGLSAADGKILLQNIIYKIKNDGLRDNQVDGEIERQLKELSKQPKPQKHIFCSQCGHKNDYVSKFCINCGEKLIK